MFNCSLVDVPNISCCLTFSFQLLHRCKFHVKTRPRVAVELPRFTEKSKVRVEDDNVLLYVRLVYDGAVLYLIVSL